jgi:hypothetical protein
MAPHERENRSLKGTILSMIAIMIGIVVCMATLLISIDLRCSVDINYWMPIYPNSEISAIQQRGFFRPRASGITQIIYVTPDDPTTVRRWYIDYRRDITRNIATNDSETAASGLASTSYQISENSDGGGSRITQTSECAYN